jgi:hypothetical protein
MSASAVGQFCTNQLAPDGTGAAPRRYCWFDGSKVGKGSLCGTKPTDASWWEGSVELRVRADDSIR